MTLHNLIVTIIGRMLMAFFVLGAFIAALGGTLIWLAVR